MAPSEYPTFSELFVSHWPNDGINEDLDFTDDNPCDDQSDFSIDGDSITSGDMEVLAKGSAAGSNDEDNTGGDEAAAVRDGAAIDEEKNNLVEERYGTHSYYTPMIAKSRPATGQRCHSQMNNSAPWQNEFLNSKRLTKKDIQRLSQLALSISRELGRNPLFSTAIL